MAQNTANLRRLSETPFFNGSLNVLLSSPVRFNSVLARDLYERDAHRLAWPAYIHDEPVWIRRWDRLPLHILELMAHNNLRQLFSLKDGDSLTIRVSSDYLERVSLSDKLMWALLWRGRETSFYTRNYSKAQHKRWLVYGASQARSTTGIAKTSSMIKETIKYLPGSKGAVRYIRKTLRNKRKKKARQPYMFQRTPLPAYSANPAAHNVTQIDNVLNYTKLSNASYNAQRHPAGYHTITIHGHNFLGQRNPAQRLSLIDSDFSGKSILDIGCNQGGMLFPLADTVRWGVGLDFDSRMINAANRIAASERYTKLDFYVFDLESEPLDLITDLIPDGTIDIIFLFAVCKWIRNWRKVIRFCANHGTITFFEANGNDEERRRQIAFLHHVFARVTVIAESVPDDLERKPRVLLRCSAR